MPQPNGPRARPCPVLVLMVGAPGTGKSYLARQLAAALDAALVQSDVIRKRRFSRPEYTPAEHAAVFALAHQRLHRLLGQGRSVVFDATNLLEEKRQEVYRLAEAASTHLLIVWTYASEADVAQRLGGRKAGRDSADESEADWQVYVRLRERMDPIPRPHFVVNTGVSLGPALERLVAAARPKALSEVS